MKTTIKSIALSLMLLFGASSYAQRVHITLAPPLIVQTEVIPDQPNVNAVWQSGFYMYNMNLGEYVWVSGKWVTPPFEGAIWITPYYRFQNNEYFLVPGHWRQHD
jgi:hypothetical protein